MKLIVENAALFKKARLENNWESVWQLVEADISLTQPTLVISSPPEKALTLAEHIFFKAIWIERILPLLPLHDRGRLAQVCRLFYSYNKELLNAYWEFPDQVLASARLGQIVRPNS